MGYEDDFELNVSVELDVVGFNKGDFLYKPSTAGDENSWLDKYMFLDENNKPKQDFAVLNKLKLNNLLKVPYDSVLIKKVIGIEKDWSDLSIDERWSLLSKLKSRVFDKILTAIAKYDDVGIIEKKA